MLVEGDHDPKLATELVHVGKPFLPVEALDGLRVLSAPFRWKGSLWVPRVDIWDAHCFARQRTRMRGERVGGDYAVRVQLIRVLKVSCNLLRFRRCLDREITLSNLEIRHTIDPRGTFRRLDGICSAEKLIIVLNTVEYISLCAIFRSPFAFGAGEET